MAKAKKKPTKAASKPAKAAKRVGKQPPAKPAKAAKRPARQPARKPAARAKAAPAKKKRSAKPHVAVKRPPVPPAAPLTADELAKLAMSGDLKVLAGLVTGTVNRDLLAYKWLAVASDFGHSDADEMLAELIGSGSLGSDAQTGQAHFELGLAYLTGTEGLPEDHDKGRSQLASAKERDYPSATPSSESILQRARGRLYSDALAVFDAVYDIASAEDNVDTAWGNEHTHHDPEPTRGGRGRDDVE